MRSSTRRVAACAIALGALAVVAGGCRQDMHDAPRYKPLAESDLFTNGSAARPVIDGTVARDHLDEDPLMYQGKVNGQPSLTFPFAITRADLDRGEERYNIYCSPCHGRTGDGNGMVVQRGFPQAASYHTDRLRHAPVGYLFGVISNGFGKMPDYRDQIPVRDRWLIVAYVRALQLSRDATLTDVPADARARLEAGK